MYPTDVVKTRAQLAGINIHCVRYRYRFHLQFHLVGKQGVNMFTAMYDMFKKEGFSKMYRGILPPILVEAPKRAVKFSANETYKPWFTSADGKLKQVHNAALLICCISYSISLFAFLNLCVKSGAIGAGVLAGCTEAFVVVPFELVKIRLQDKANVRDSFLLSFN
jgi:solute carrier family 25 2-oxodicarboxylate transporter 21